MATFEIHVEWKEPTLAAVIKNIIFDWSGTLVDDLPAVLAATNDVMRGFELPEFTIDQFCARFRFPLEAFCAEFTMSIPPAQIEARFHSCFKARQSSVAELPYAREFLKFCRRRQLRTFVLSAVPAEYYTRQAALTGFGEWIDHVSLGARDKRLQISGLLTTHKLQPDETLFIGDMQHDIETARCGGVHSCAVLTGYNDLAQLRSSLPDLIVEHLGELQSILELNHLELRPPQKTGSPTSSSLPVVTVGVLIYDAAGRVLMVRTRKWSSLWGIPGGKVKYGETLEAALRREIKEETNLDLDDVRFMLVQDCIGSDEFYREAHFVLLNYTALRLGTNEVILNEEAQEFRWVPLREALAMRLNRPTRFLLESVPK